MDTAPSTPPAAPYNSFSVDIEPLANSSFFSHDDDDNEPRNEDTNMEEEDLRSFRLRRGHRRERHRSHTPIQVSEYNDDSGEYEEIEEDYSGDPDSINSNSTMEDIGNDSMFDRRQTHTPPSPTRTNTDIPNETTHPNNTSTSTNSTGTNTANNDPVITTNPTDDNETNNDNNNHSDDADHPNNNIALLQATSTLYPQNSPHLRELGQEQTLWSLSTAKPGNGVEQLRDDSHDTYWQSDGGQPHLLNIQFTQRKPLCMICFYLDYNLDESYTPKQLSVRVGMTFHDLEELKVVELSEPVGWICIPLKGKLDPLDDPEEEEGEEKDNNEEQEDEHDDDYREKLSKREHNILGVDFSKILPEEVDIVKQQNREIRKAWKRPIKTHFIQICVASMHQNGRDTHIRQVKLFGPRKEDHNYYHPYSSLNRITMAMEANEVKHDLYHQHPHHTKLSSRQKVVCDRNVDKSCKGDSITENDDKNTIMSSLGDGFMYNFQTVAMTQFNTIR